jgi:hypothetical protein
MAFVTATKTLPGRTGGSQSAVAAPLCRRTPDGVPFALVNLIGRLSLEVYEWVAIKEAWIDFHIGCSVSLFLFSGR